MTRTLLIAAGVLLCGGGLSVARADCGPAPRPAFAIPDGAHASEDEMSAARDNLSEYSAQVAAFASCLDAEQARNEHATGVAAQRARSEYLGLGSAALLRLASVVSCFSEQVQAFQATGGGTDAGPALCSAPPGTRRNVSLRQMGRQPR